MTVCVSVTGGIVKVVVTLSICVADRVAMMDVVRITN
jgi:hypothetical protein